MTTSRITSGELPSHRNGFIDSTISAAYEALPFAFTNLG